MQTRSRRVLGSPVYPLDEGLRVRTLLRRRASGRNARCPEGGISLLGGAQGLPVDDDTVGIPLCLRGTTTVALRRGGLRMGGGSPPPRSDLGGLDLAAERLTVRGLRLFDIRGAGGRPA